MDTLLSIMNSVPSQLMKYGISLFIILTCIVFSLFPADIVTIVGQAAISIDIDTHEIIFAREIDREMFPASTTKLLTALLLEQNRKKDDILIYSAKAKAEDAYKLDLPVNTEMKAADAMDALLLYSANDIAYMIGETIGNDIPGFSKLMNEYAAGLGLLHSYFLNPNGLHEEGHFTSAYDMSIIVREAYQHPWVKETMEKKESVIFAGTPLEMELKNRNKLVGENGCVGGKTGWTPEAGRCLAALFERNGRKIAGVVLNSEYDYNDKTVFADMLTLIDYSFALEKNTIIEAGTDVQAVPVSFRLFPFIGPIIEHTIKLYIRDRVAVYPDADEPRISFSIPAPDIFSIDKNKSAGSIVISLREREDRFPIFPDISTPDLLVKYFLPFYAVILIVTIVFACIIIVIVKSRKKRTIAEK